MLLKNNHKNKNNKNTGNSASNNHRNKLAGITRLAIKIDTTIIIKTTKTNHNHDTDTDNENTQTNLVPFGTLPQLQLSMPAVPDAGGKTSKFGHLGVNPKP